MGANPNEMDDDNNPPRRPRSLHSRPPSTLFPLAVVLRVNRLLRGVNRRLVHGIQKRTEENYSSERRSLESVFFEGKKRVKALGDCHSKHLKAGSLLDSHMRKADVDTCNPKRFLEKNDYFSHVGKSVYILQLYRWINLFGRDNVKVCCVPSCLREEGRQRNKSKYL